MATQYWTKNRVKMIGKVCMKLGGVLVCDRGGGKEGGWKGSREKNRGEGAVVRLEDREAGKARNNSHEVSRIDKGASELRRWEVAKKDPGTKQKSKHVAVL
ncbi:unnamed protein product [Prunus armeniaca]|uniref:Uncharacterized protein n=1 Tax=Prunus armeniaca TaxID=36596 RepID=A0A6J5VRW7_PRUAR|nr:unnamed protein product [Prunus armeniaca]